MLVDIQPYLYGIIPSPLGNRVAQSIAWYGPTHGLSVVVGQRDGGRSTEIARFGTLLPAAVMWCPEGRFLAVAQSDLCQITDGERGSTWNLPGPCRKLAWDNGSILWGISGDVLWRCSENEGFKPTTVLDGVLSACVSSFLAAIRISKDAQEILWRCGTSQRSFAWPLSVRRRCDIRPALDDSGLIVSAEESLRGGEVLVEMAFLDLATGDSNRFFSARLKRRLGWENVHWRPWTRQRVLMGCESDQASQIFACDVGSQSRVVLSPAGFDVSSFAGSVASGRIAMVGTPLATRSGSVEDWLICHKESDGQQAHTIVNRGVNRLPAWNREGDVLFYAHATSDFESEVTVYETQNRNRYPRYMPSSAPKSTGRSTEWLELAGPANRMIAIIHLQGPHRRFLKGPQSTFFHHALMSLMAQLASEGYLVSCLNGTGFSGTSGMNGGNSTSWFDDTVSGLSHRTEALVHQGFERIGVVAGSLGALPALHFLTKKRLAAGFFISPVYGPFIPPLKEWQHLFGSAATTQGPEQLAQNITTPVLVLHGIRDEMSPAEHSSRFVSNVPSDVPCEYITFSDEAHIFVQPATWRTVLSTAYRFLTQHLNGSQ